MNVVLERWSGSHWAAALLLAGLLVSARQAAWAAPHDTDLQTLKGAVERFNHSPEGRYESILLKSGDKLVQVNFPPIMAAEVTKAVATGDQISVVAVAVDSKGNHPVYRLRKLTTAKGGEINTERKINGVVKHLNYTHRGEVNGAVLDNGDFVHMGPRGADLVKLAIDQKLSIEGAAATMADGHLVIEHPSEVNGIKMPGGSPKHAEK
jgi:hypothetical protein